MPGSAHTTCAPARSRPESGQAFLPRITPLPGRTDSAPHPSPLPTILPANAGLRSNAHVETKMVAARQPYVVPYRLCDVRSPSGVLCADCLAHDPTARATSFVPRPSILLQLLPRRIDSNLCERLGLRQLHAHSTTVPAQTRGWFPAWPGAAHLRIRSGAGGFCSRGIRAHLSKLESPQRIEPLPTCIHPRILPANETSFSRRHPASHNSIEPCCGVSADAQADHARRW